jgi:hydrogenase maturation protein HypF
MGRLFDAVSSLLDLRHTVSYEAQAAVELETVASAASDGGRIYRFSIGAGQIDPAPVLRAIVADLRQGRPVGAIAAAFHVAVASLIVEVAAQVRAATGLRQVALSGGVFQNVLVTRLARTALTEQGFSVLTHHLVPPNDGGLALGQTVVAAAGMPAPEP